MKSAYCNHVMALLLKVTENWVTLSMQGTGKYNLNPVKSKKCNTTIININNMASTIFQVDLVFTVTDSC